MYDPMLEDADELSVQSSASYHTEPEPEDIKAPKAAIVSAEALDFDDLDEIRAKVLNRLVSERLLTLVYSDFS